MRKKSKIVFLFAALILAVLSCGSGEKSGNNTSSRPTPSPSPTPSGPSFSDVYLGICKSRH